ncbi:hypothetical protein BH11PSE12_BH11PSE12_31530 [soil metagenome]
MPPTLLLMALVMVAGEFAPFNILLILSAGCAEWHAAQLS